MSRFITTAYGGTALTTTVADHVLHDAGLTDVTPLHTPTGATASRSPTTLTPQQPHVPHTRRTTRDITNNPKHEDGERPG